VFRKWDTRIPWYDNVKGEDGMGRPATATGRLSIDVDPALKLRASIFAMKNGLSLTELVERGLVLAMAEARAKAGVAKMPPKRRAPEQLPLEQREGQT
jgi:hypothetical protein